MRVFEQCGVHVARVEPADDETTAGQLPLLASLLRTSVRERNILKELAVRIEDDDGDIGRAQDAEFVRLFEETILALEESHLAIAVVLDWRDRNLAATHGRSRMGWQKRAGRKGGFEVRRMCEIWKGTSPDRRLLKTR